MTDKALKEAQKIAKSIEEEGDGAKNAVISFHRSLTLRGLNSMRCSILEDRVAVWSLKNTNLRLSALAAELLIERKRITWKQLRLIRHNEWNDFEGPGEPLTGGATAIMGSLTGIAAGVGSVPFKLAKSSKRRAKHEEKKRRKSEQVEARKSGNGSHTIANGQKSYGHANKKDQVKQGIKDEQKNGHTKRDATNETSQSTNEPTNGEIPHSKAPGGSEDKATAGPDMGKHTVSGEPIGQNQDANREEEARLGEDEDGDLSDDPEDNAAEEMAQDVGSGLGRTAEALARMPMDLSLAVAQGFHNAPRLYGDTTVRR